MPGDFEVAFYTDNAIPVDPEAVVFTVFDLTSSPPDRIPVGVPAQPAIRTCAGRYYARFEIGSRFALGSYEVVYNYAIRDNAGNLQSLALTLPFEVVDVYPQTLPDAALVLIHKLRVVLRDSDPDSYYKFAPPLKTGEIKGFTKETGYIWKDDELNIFLEIATNELRATPFGSVVGIYPSGIQQRFEPAIIMLAAFYAAYSESIRWISEHFEYTIDGVSLSIDRSSQFQAWADAMRGAAQTQLEFLAKTIRFTKGVKMTNSVSRGAALGPSVASSPILNFIQGKYKV